MYTVITKTRNEAITNHLVRHLCSAAQWNPRDGKSEMRDGSRRIQPKAVGEDGPKSCLMEASD